MSPSTNLFNTFLRQHSTLYLIHISQLDLKGAESLDCPVFIVSFCSKSFHAIQIFLFYTTCDLKLKWSGNPFEVLILQFWKKITVVCITRSIINLNLVQFFRTEHSGRLRYIVNLLSCENFIQLLNFKSDLKRRTWPSYFSIWSKICRSPVTSKRWMCSSLLYFNGTPDNMKHLCKPMAFSNSTVDFHISMISYLRRVHFQPQMSWEAFAVKSMWNLPDLQNSYWRGSII